MEWRICRARRAGVGGAVAQRPLPLAFLQKLEVGGERVVVERRLNLEDLDSLRDEPAHAPVRGVQLGGGLVHERLGVAHRLRVVVVAQAAVAGQTSGHALVAAVHGHQVDVDVHEQVRGGGALVDLDVLALHRLPQMNEVVRVLGVVLGQQAVRREGVVDPVAQRVAQFLFGHAPV